jgi:hypothetical protein
MRLLMQRTVASLLCCFFLALLVAGPVLTAMAPSQDPQLIGYHAPRVLSTDEKIQGIIEKINETLLRRFMEYLVFEVGCRYTGTYGCQKAADYIYRKFETMGLQVKYHYWSAYGNRWHRGLFVSQNIEAILPGVNPDWDEVIIFNAHYDTVKGTVGANDDGSGTVAVLAAAYALSHYDFNRTMMFVTFSGEEVGLLGSSVYARDLYDRHVPVLVEINADMIGRATTAESGRKLRLSMTEDAGWIGGRMQEMSSQYGLDFNITAGWSIDRDARRGYSDYFPFVQLGYEAVAVWQAESDPHMHTPEDDITNVNFSYLVNTTRHIAATMAILADAMVDVPRVSIANPRFGTIIYKDSMRRTIRHRTPIVIDETTIYAEVRQGSYPIERVEFYYDNRLVHIDTEKPFTYLLTKRSAGFHVLRVVVYDTMGDSAVDQMKILFLNLKYI